MTITKKQKILLMQFNGDKSIYCDNYALKKSLIKKCICKELNFYKNRLVLTKIGEKVLNSINIAR